MGDGVRRTILAAFLAWGAVIIQGGTAVAQDTAAPRPPVWTVPQISALPNDHYGKLVHQGRDLIDATYAHIGPLVAAPAKRFAGNNLACSDCHLRAGTKMFGLPIFGLFGKYPLYGARSGAEVTIRDRIDLCMTRSMNGRALPAGAPEMAAIVAYIKSCRPGSRPVKSCRASAAGICPSWTAPPIPSAASRSTQEAALLVTMRKAQGFAAAFRGPTPATRYRRYGARTASTTGQA